MTYFQAKTIDADTVDHGFDPSEPSVAQAADLSTKWSGGFDCDRPTNSLRIKQTFDGEKRPKPFDVLFSSSSSLNHVGPFSSLLWAVITPKIVDKVIFSRWMSQEGIDIFLQIDAMSMSVTFLIAAKAPSIKKLTSLISIKEKQSCHTKGEPTNLHNPQSKPLN